MLGPEAEDAVVGGDQPDAFPEKLPRLVGDVGIHVSLAVQPRMLPHDLNADGAEKLAVGGFHELKFREAFFQVVGGQMPGVPKRLEALKIVGGGAADTQVGRTHRPFITISPASWQLGQSAGSVVI